MWTTACRNCGWTSGKCVIKDAALGQLHEQDHPGHGVVLQEVPDGSSPPQRPSGDSL